MLTLEQCAIVMDSKKLEKREPKVPPKAPPIPYSSFDNGSELVSSSIDDLDDDGYGDEESISQDSGSSKESNSRGEEKKDFMRMGTIKEQPEEYPDHPRRNCLSGEASPVQKFRKDNSSN